MKISCLMTTYGRVAHVQTALQDFLSQTHPERELIIVNSCTEQALAFEHPLVRIINLKERPKSLGACRNIAVEEATGDLMVTFDDDDRYLPFHVENFNALVGETDEWAWMENQWYSEKGKIIKRMSGSYNTFAFRKSAWEKVGRYNELSVGEDKHFVSRVTVACASGKKLSLPDDFTSFIYCWGNNAYHISGHGVDTGELKPAYERVADDLKRRFDIGIEPKGDIVLALPDEQDLTLLVKEFLDAESSKNEQKLPVCVVELGRYGDIVNILPICRHIAENYARPHLMVAREFESVLAGVSYVIPEVVDIYYDRIDSAMHMAQRRFPIVLRGQIWGKNHKQQKLTVSYNVESWRELGFLCRFNDPGFELIFDRRDARRESQLVSKLANEKPMLLVQVTGSISSPFPEGNELLKAIQGEFKDLLNIIDLGTVRAEKIYDVIGLMDKAVGMVAVDTAVIHLAAASAVPVIALVNHLPWAGSYLRCNCWNRIPYNQAKPEPVIAAIKAILKDDVGLQPKTYNLNLKRNPVNTAPRRRIFHLVDTHQSTDPETIARVGMAKSSWDLLYESGKVIPAHFSQYPRDARSIGDTRPLPFLKDALMFAMNQAASDDLIAWTNDDNILHTELPAQVLFYGSLYDATCSSRIDLTRAMPMRTLNPADMARNSEPHFGRDLFVFKKWWLEDFWEEIGDYILAASDWDVAMTALVRLYHGIKSDRNSFLRHIYPAEMPRGYVYHVNHASKWAVGRYLHESAANQHNRKIWRAFAEKHLPELKFTDQNCI